MNNVRVAIEGYNFSKVQHKMFFKNKIIIKCMMADAFFM